MNTTTARSAAAPARYRDRLPQLDGGVWLTDGGLETAMIFHDGLELPQFAAFVLLESETGIGHLRRYYERYLDLAAAHGTGFVLESPTWRANPDWAAQLGYSATALGEANRRSIALMAELRTAYDTRVAPIVISGCVGPQGDGYSPDAKLTAEEARVYHSQQVAAFAETEADMVTAITITYAEEAIGVTAAARAAGMPVAISFTLETDGRLPSGQTLAAAIAQVDAETAGGPEYYMINCAHPTHFDGVLDPGAPWVGRIRGLRANASRMSHAELDEAPELDEGDPVELGGQYAELARTLASLNVLGGCCGTDHRHVGAIAQAWSAAR